MAHTAIVSEQAKPVAHYQMATRQDSGRLVYISGQVAWDAEGNTVGRGDIRAQARHVFQNLRQVLQEAGGDLSDLLKITTYVTRLDDYPTVVEVRQEFFPDGLPASTLIVVESLFHADWLLEVEGMAAIG
jgi:enamine deaminase RidA (YjgF/YER057c/UK114 family)